MERRLCAAFSFLLPLAAASGCGQTEPAKPGAKPSPADTRQSDPPPDPDPDPDSDASDDQDKADPETASKNRTAYLASLTKGRSLTKSKRYDEAIEVFEEALELDPDNVALLGELGWAAFLAGEYALCDRMTNRALVFARENKTRGMLLYNLGRSAEATGELETARAHYEHSLRLRKNKTVRQRLASLDGADEPATDDAVAPAAAGDEGVALPDVTPDAAPDALGVAADSVADLEAACAWLVEHRCDEVSTFTGDSCRCDQGATTQDADLAAAVLTLATGDGGAGNRAAFVATRPGSAGPWQLSEPIGWEYNPGAFGIFEELVVSGLQLRTDLFEDKSAVMVEIKKERVDSNLGSNELESESARYVVVCAQASKGTIGCTQGLLRAFTFGKTALIDPADDPEVPAVKEVKIEFKTELVFPGDGQVRSSAGAPANLPRPPSPMVSLAKGDHSIIQLLKPRP